MMTRLFNIGQGLLSQYFEFSDVNWERVWDATYDTIYMTVASVIVVLILGILIGLLLFETREKNNFFTLALNRV